MIYCLFTLAVHSRVSRIPITSAQHKVPPPPHIHGTRRFRGAHRRCWTAVYCIFSSTVAFPPPHPEGGVGLVPKHGRLLTLVYYAFPRLYEFGQRRWNDILTGENRRTRIKTCPSVTLSTTNPTWIDPEANPGLRGERPATNDLSHGTALHSCFTLGTSNVLKRWVVPHILSMPRTPIKYVIFTNVVQLHTCFKVSSNGELRCDHIS
jgi:hypothetical protein